MTICDDLSLFKVSTEVVTKPNVPRRVFKNNVAAKDTAATVALKVRKMVFIWAKSPVLITHNLFAAVFSTILAFDKDVYLGIESQTIYG